MTRFDIVLVPFPFADLSKNKKRPALVLTCIKPEQLPLHCIVAMVTSNLEGMKFPHDFILKDYEAAGLPKPSLVRISKLVTIDSSIVVKTLGSLAQPDRIAVKKALSRLWKS